MVPGPQDSYDPVKCVNIASVHRRGPCLRKPPVAGDGCARQGLETLQVSTGGNLIAGAGHSTVDGLRNRGGDGATTQRSATARKPVAPGLEGDQRRWLLRAELPKRRENPHDSGDGSCGSKRAREGRGAGAGGERGVWARTPDSAQPPGMSYCRRHC